MLTVHAAPGTESKLTKETNGPNGITGVMCDIDGKPLGADQAHLARSTYFDTVGGKRIIRLTESEKEQMLKDGKPVFHGVGEISGFFAEAPDFTINGVYGEKAKSEPAPSSPEA